MFYVNLNNCIVYGNIRNNFDSCVLNYSCTEPKSDGVGNITNPPLFVNPSAGNFHLQTNSPCINAGNNTFTVGTNDLDELARVAGGTVDLGAFELQNPASIISYAWLQQYGLPNDGSADNLDPDGDGFSNWQEWRAGTSPLNAASRLQMLPPANTNNASGVTITWQSVNGIHYFIQRSGNLSAPPSFLILQSNLVGQTGTTSFTDTGATGAGPFFYRVGVQ